MNKFEQQEKKIVSIIHNWECENIFKQNDVARRRRKLVLNYIVKRYARTKDIQVPLGQSRKEAIALQDEITASDEFQQWALDNYAVVVTNFDTGLGYRKTTINRIPTNALLAIKFGYLWENPSETTEQTFSRKERALERYNYEISKEREQHRRLIAIENGRD